MKKINLNVILFLTAIALIGIFMSSGVLGLGEAVNGNVTVTLRGSNIIKGSATSVLSQVNCSIADTYQAHNYTNASFYLMSASTGNSSYVWIGNTTNLSSDRFFNMTFNTAILEDSNDYILNCTLWNETKKISNILTGVIIDNTVPQYTTTIPTDASRDQNGTINFTVAVSGRNTTGCTLYFSEGNPGSSSYTMTHSGNFCSYHIASIPRQSYKWYTILSDGSNTTTTSTSTVEVAPPVSAPKNVYLQDQLDKGNLKVVDGKYVTVQKGLLQKSLFGIPIWMIGLIAVAIVGLIIYYNRK